MDKEVYEVRLSNWKQVVQQCQNRPKEMTQEEWLEQHDIPRGQFYYWLRKIRKGALAEIASNNTSIAPAAVEMAAAAEPVTFAEIDLTKMQDCSASDSSSQAAAVIRLGRLSVELSNSADEHLIFGILKAVSHAC